MKRDLYKDKIPEVDGSQDTKMLLFHETHLAKWFAESYQQRSQRQDSDLFLRNDPIKNITVYSNAGLSSETICPRESLGDAGGWSLS